MYRDDRWIPASKTDVVSFTASPLELLAMERIIARYDSGDSDLEEFLPKDHPIRRTLEARRMTSTLEHMVYISKIWR